MSKEKNIKQFTVEFNDCTHTFEGTSTAVKCSVTGNTKRFYTPYIIGLIKRKYNNNYYEFLDSYKCRASKAQACDSVEDEEPDLTLYKTFLRQQYKAYTSSKDMSVRAKAITTLDNFNKRFPDESIHTVDYL